MPMGDGMDDGYEVELDGPLTKRHLMALILELKGITINEADRKLHIGLEQIEVWCRELKKEGNSQYRETEFSGPPLPPEKVKVVQGFLEKSNVNAVREMVDMIEVQRSYEANQKTIVTHDQALGRLINDVGR